MEKSKPRISFLVGFGLFGLCLSGFLLPDFYLSTNLISSIFNASGTLQNFEQLASNEMKQPYDALILAYMRSGSSFIGSIVGHRNDTFYWYEPFWRPHDWKFLSSEDTWCNYKSPGCARVAEMSMASTNKSIQYLLDLYTCRNVSKYFNRFLGLQGSARLSGPSGAVYQNCQTIECKGCPSPVQCKACKLNRSKFCFEKQMNRCETTKHKVTKLVRMDTANAQVLLENHKRLKLIQIVRDPRAVMNSRRNARWYYKQGRITSSDAEILCNRMEHDIDTAERLSILFPDRVKIIQYEDFGDLNMLAVTLYSFLNMEMTSEAETLLNNFRKSGGKGKIGFHPDSYRQSLPWNTTQFTTKACLSVYKKLGLRVFENVKEYEDTNISVILNKIPYAVNRIKPGA